MKALVLFSGGLDSRLVVKLLEEQGNEVEAVFFLLPFSKQELPEFDVKMHIIDCTKGQNLKGYLDMLKSPKYGRGTGMNPCVDCKLFMFGLAENLRKKLKADFLATGEVIGQRPMSQTKKKLDLIDKEIPGIKRPLIEAGIAGRRRDKQLALEEKFKIDFPSPAGGCLLCERDLAHRFKFLLEKDLINEKTLGLAKIARHFYIEGSWFVVARNERESAIIEKYKNSIASDKRKPAVYCKEVSEKSKEKAKKLQEAYSTGEEKLRKEFEEFRIK
jgi:tRNA-uridine 2-sulfurtransferase